VRRASAKLQNCLHHLLHEIIGSLKAELIEALDYNECAFLLCILAFVFETTLDTLLVVKELFERFWLLLGQLLFFSKQKHIMNTLILHI